MLIEFFFNRRSGRGYGYVGDLYTQLCAPWLPVARPLYNGKTNAK